MQRGGIRDVQNTITWNTEHQRHQMVLTIWLTRAHWNSLFSKCNSMLCFSTTHSLGCMHINSYIQMYICFFHNMFQLLTLVLLSFRFSICNLFKSTKAKVNVANVHFTGWLTNMKTGNSPVCMYVSSISSSPLRLPFAVLFIICKAKMSIKTLHLHYGIPWLRAMWFSAFYWQKPFIRNMKIIMESKLIIK